MLETDTELLEPITESEPELEEESNTVEIDTLGKCEILKIHDDGDLTVACGGKKYMVTPDGDIFESLGRNLPKEEESDE